MSNGIYLLVDTNKTHFVQTCFDVDCKDFISPQLVIPANFFEEDHDPPPNPLEVIDLEPYQREENKRILASIRANIQKKQFTDAKGEQKHL